jgi:hypothetical protein
MKKTGSHAALLKSPHEKPDNSYGLSGSKLGNYLRANPAKYRADNIKMYQNYSSHQVSRG